MEAHGIDALQFRAPCLNGYGPRAGGGAHEQKGRREIRAKHVLRQPEARRRRRLAPFDDSPRCGSRHRLGAAREGRIRNAQTHRLAFETDALQVSLRPCAEQDKPASGGGLDSRQRLASISCQRNAVQVGQSSRPNAAIPSNGVAGGILGTHSRGPRIQTLAIAGDVSGERRRGPRQPTGLLQAHLLLVARALVGRAGSRPPAHLRHGRGRVEWALGGRSGQRWPP